MIVEKEKINALGSNGIRNLKKGLYANLVDSDRVGNVLSDITSRVDLRQENNKQDKFGVEENRIKKTKKTRKTSKTIREKYIKPIDEIEKVDEEKVETEKVDKEIEKSKNNDNNQNKKLKLEDFSKSDLKALKKTLVKESKKNKKVLNDLINASNNHIKGLEESEIVSKSKNAKRKVSGCEQNLVFKSYSQLDLNDLSRLIEVSGENNSKDEVEKPELMFDLKKNLSKCDLKKTNINKVVDFDHLLEEKYTIHGLEGRKKEIMNYSEMMSSKLDSMLENLQSDVRRIVRKTKNYDYLSKHSSFSLEHIQDIHCDLFSIDIEDSSSLPLNFNSSAHQGISTFSSCMANSSYLPARTTNRFYLDTNDSSAPIDINNSNCAAYNVHGNTAFFDNKAARTCRQNQVRELTVEKVGNCLCDDYEQRCQQGRVFQMPTKPSYGGVGGSCCPKSLNGGGGGGSCCPKPLNGGGGGGCCSSKSSCCDKGCCAMSSSGNGGCCSKPTCGNGGCCSKSSCCDGGEVCCCPKPRCCCGGGGCCSKPMGCSGGCCPMSSCGGGGCCPMPSCCGGGGSCCCPRPVCCCGGVGCCLKPMCCCGRGCGCEVNHCPLCCSCDTTDVILCRSCGSLTPKPKCLGCIKCC